MVGGNSVWQQWFLAVAVAVAAVAAVGTVLGGSRGANTSTFRMPHLTFYTLAYVQLPHTHARAHFPLFRIFLSESASFRHGTNRHGCVVSTEHRGCRSTYLMYRLSAHRLRTILHTGFELFSNSFLKSALRHWFVLLIYCSSERPAAMCSSCYNLNTLIRNRDCLQF